MWIFDITILHIIGVLLVGWSCGDIVSIHTSQTGQVGSNETYIECLINIQDIFRVRQVILFAFPNGIRKTIITYYDYGDTTISPSGIYLRGRVTYNTITGLSNKTELRFNELLCEDETEYQCKLEYLKVSGGSTEENYSTNSNLTVKVPLSTPISIDLLRGYSSQKEMESHSADITNTTHLNASTIGKFHNSDNIDDCFLQINEEFIECSDVVVTCVGTVEDEKDNLAVQMVVNETIVSNLTTYSDQSDSVIRENCSFIRTTSFATNLTLTKNKIQFRCVPTSLLHEEGMYLETEEVKLSYPVKTPFIIIEPENATSPPVSLNCIADGNPTPHYEWYKYENGSTTFIVSQQNITIQHAKDSGTYKCVVNNTLGQQETEKNITLQEVPTTTPMTTEAETTIPTTIPEYSTTTIMTTDVKTTTPTSTPAYHKTTPTADESKNDAKKLVPIIAGVVGGVAFIIIVAVIIIKCRHSSKPENIQRRDDDLKMSSRKGVDNYYSMTLDEDNGKQRDSAEVQNQKEETRKHNERYLKQQELESNNRQGDSQHVEYAAVNKPKKGKPYQNTDFPQPAEYAQVNKMRGNSNEPAPDYDDDPYASGKGIYDHAHDRRHKKTEDLESYDTAATVMNRKSGKNKTNLGSVPDTTAEALKLRQERQSRAINQVDDNLKENVEPKTSL